MQTLAEEFLEGSLPLDSFLERFLALRSLAHKRRVRIEKLQEALRQKSQTAVDNAAAAATSSGAGQDPAITSSPWQPVQPHPQPQTAAKPSGGYSNSPQNPSGSGLPYGPFPGASPAQPAAAASAGGPANPPAQFPPYPSPGSSFTPVPGYAASRGPGACPYPSQPAFSAIPAPPFGQFGPSAAPYPSGGYPYSTPGYNYPIGPTLPPSQSNSGRPVYQSGFRVPQSYS